MQINIKDILEVASLHDSQRPRGHQCIVARQAAPEVSTLNQRVTFICYQSPERDGLITAVKSIGSLFICEYSEYFHSVSHHVSREELKQYDFPLDSPMTGTPC